MREARAAFEAPWRPGERAAVAEHRDAVPHVLRRGAPALVVAGGHVGVLLHVLRLFAVPAPPAVIAWSAGAMALTERVLLFHDRAPHGPAHAEFLDAGARVARAAASCCRTRAGGCGPTTRRGWPSWPRRAAPAALRGARRRRPARPRTARRQLPAGRAASVGRPDRTRSRRGGIVSRRLAINRLKDAQSRTPRPSTGSWPGTRCRSSRASRCTFLWRGEADEVHLVQRIVGLPDRLPLRRLWGTDLWYLVLELPEGSRINYQIEVRRGEHVERINDPLNPKLSYSPVGTLVGLLRARLRHAGLDRARPRRPARAS